MEIKYIYVISRVKVEKARIIRPNKCCERKYSRLIVSRQRFHDLLLYGEIYRAFFAFSPSLLMCFLLSIP